MCCGWMLFIYFDKNMVQSYQRITWPNVFTSHKFIVVASFLLRSHFSPQLFQRAFLTVEPHSHLKQNISLPCLQIPIEILFCLQHLNTTLPRCKYVSIQTRPHTSNFNRPNILFCHQLFLCTFPKWRQKWPEVSKGEFMYTWLFFFPSTKM